MMAGDFTETMAIQVMMPKAIGVQQAKADMIILDIIDKPTKVDMIQKVIIDAVARAVTILTGTIGQALKAGL